MNKVEQIIEQIKNKKIQIEDLLNLSLEEQEFDMVMKALKKSGIDIEENFEESELDVETNYTNDIVKQYLEEIGKFPILSKEEETKLFSEYSTTNDVKIREKIINSNLKLVVNIAKRYYYKIKLNTVGFLDLIQDGNSGLIKARMAEKLEHLLSNIGFVISDVSEEQEYPLYEEDLDVLDELSEIEEPENIEKQFFYSEKLSTETEKDILNTALKILEEYLVNDDYKNIKINLIEFKYRMSYLFQNLEYEFLKDIFGIKEKLYWGAELIVDLGRGEKEDLVLCKNSYAEDMLYDQEENLMNFKYQDLNNIDVYASAIICQIIIRAALLFVDDERRENFKEFFLSEYEFGNKENSILDKIVADTFSKYEKDLELPWILSLKPKQ